MGKKRIIRQTQEELLKETQNAKAAQPSVISKKAGSITPEARVYLYSSYNNTLMSLTDERGNVFFHASAGMAGFKGTKKGTPFAASRVAELIAEAARNRGVERIKILVKGVGPGRDTALRTLGAKGMEIASVKDVTPIPHNGPRPPKVRRV